VHDDAAVAVYRENRRHGRVVVRDHDLGARRRSGSFGASAAYSIAALVRRDAVLVQNTHMQKRFYRVSMW
jgi:hypothetical protein